MPIRMTYNTTIIELRNPERENVLEVNKRQVLGRTASGQVFTYEKGIETKKLELEFQRLRDDEKSNLESFFSTVDGIMNTFTYKDHRGNTYTARFLDSILRFSEVLNEGKSQYGYSTYNGFRFSKGFWNIAIKLEVS